MILLFGSHYGKDTSELDSGYLIWIIEKYDGADWVLIEECKKELSERLKLSFEPQSEQHRTIIQASDALCHLNKQLLSRIDLLEKCLIMATEFGTSRLNVDGYLQNPKLLEQHLQFIRDVNIRLN